MRRVDRNFTNFAADISRGQGCSKLCSILLELSEDLLRFDFPGVPAAHQMVLEDGPGGEGEVAHLAGDGVPGCARHRVTAAPLPGPLLGGGVGSGAGVGGHAQERAGLSGLAVPAAGEARGETRRHDAVTGCLVLSAGHLPPPGRARGRGGAVGRVGGGGGGRWRGLGLGLLVVVVERSLISPREVVSRGRGLGRVSSAGRRVGVHCRYRGLHRPTAVVVVDELPGKVVVDSLAGLEAELQVGEPLLVLLAGDVNACLLAGVELSVADPAVVLESWRPDHVPRTLQK